MIGTTCLNYTNTASQAVLQLRVGIDKDAVASVVQTSAINGFLAEAESIERLLREDPAAWTGATPAESIDLMLTSEAILDSARSGRAVEMRA